MPLGASLIAQTADDWRIDVFRISPVPLVRSSDKQQRSSRLRDSPTMGAGAALSR
jgi:hypothetical protein